MQYNALVDSPFIGAEIANRRSRVSENESDEILMLVYVHITGTCNMVVKPSQPTMGPAVAPQALILQCRYAPMKRTLYLPFLISSCIP